MHRTCLSHRQCLDNAKTLDFGRFNAYSCNAMTMTLVGEVFFSIVYECLQQRHQTPVIVKLLALYSLCIYTSTSRTGKTTSNHIPNCITPQGLWVSW